MFDLESQIEKRASFVVSSQQLHVDSKPSKSFPQENFVDSYNNLTLKSMFMLKFATTQLDSTPFGFLFKVDDDTFVNVKALVKYTTVMARYTIRN